MGAGPAETDENTITLQKLKSTGGKRKFGLTSQSASPPVVPETGV